MESRQRCLAGARSSTVVHVAEELMGESGVMFSDHLISRFQGFWFHEYATHSLFIGQQSTGWARKP